MSCHLLKAAVIVAVEDTQVILNHECQKVMNVILADECIGDKSCSIWLESSLICDWVPTEY